MSSSRKRTDLIERIRYPNPLPLPPYPPKLLNIDSPAERYADPAWSSRLADLVPFPLVVDGEGGMPLDINVFPELWATDAQGRPIDGALPPLEPSQIHSEDAWLLNPTLSTAPVPPLVTPAYLRKQQANGASGTATPTLEALGAKDVGWLRRTEYLGADRKAKAEAAVRSARQGDKAGVDVSPSAEASRIEAAFAAAEVPLDKMQHPTKKDLRPVESFELLPDFDTWATQFHILKFSDAPGRHEDARQVVDPRLNVSLLRARPDPFTMRPLVSFFLPTTIPADLSPQEFDEILLADPDAFDEEDRAFFQDQAGDLDDTVREAAVLRREEMRRRSGWAAELPQEPEEVEGEDEEEAQGKMVAFARERAKLTTPYSHQRDYEPERQGGEEEWQRILVINFGEGQESSSSSSSLQSLVVRERESIQNGYMEGGGKKAYYHPITQRTTLRVKRSRRPDAHNADSDYWQNIALTHHELSERDRLKRLHKRAEIDLLREPLPELEESEAEEEEEEAEEEEVVHTADDAEEDGEGDVDEGDDDESDRPASRPRLGKSNIGSTATNGGQKRAGIATSEDESDEEGEEIKVSADAPRPRSSSSNGDEPSSPAAAPSGTNGATLPVAPSPSSSREEGDSDSNSDDDDDDDDDDAESLDADEELAALAEEAGQTGEEVAGEDGGDSGAGRGGRGSRRRAAAVAAMDTADD